MAFDPDEPRDEKGQWTSSGGVSKSARMWGTEGRPGAMRSSGTVAAERVFGAGVTDEHLVSMLGDHPDLPKGSLRITGYPGKSSIGEKYPEGAIGVSYYAESDDPEHDWEIKRAFYRNAAGELEVHHDLFTLPKSARGKGIAKAVLRDQVTQEKKAGVQRITLDAAWDGKAVWPKLGFRVVGKKTGKTIKMEATPDEILAKLGERHDSRTGSGRCDGRAISGGGRAREDATRESKRLGGAADGATNRERSQGARVSGGTRNGIRDSVRSGVGRKRAPTPAVKPPKALAWRAEYERRLRGLHRAFAEHVIDHAKMTLGAREDAKKEVPHEAIFGTAEHLPKKVKVGRIAEIGGLNRANFLKDPGSYRASSFASVRAAPREALPPVEVEVLADGGVVLRDGRHRLAVAIERGEETIRAHVVQRDAQYNVIASYVGDVPTGAIKTTFTDAPKPRAGTIESELTDMFGPLLESLGLDKFLRRMGHAITKQQANYLKRVANVSVSGVAPAAKLEAWRQQNLSLIRSLGADQIQAVGDILRPAQNMGLRWEDVADQIQATLGVGERRARLIARDQTNKWNGAMQQQTQGDAGITRYKWVTANNQAVRGRPGGVYAKSKENHWALRGTIQRWDSPPTIPGTDVQSHPGGRIQCHCQAVPVVPWLES